MGEQTGERAAVKDTSGRGALYSFDDERLLIRAGKRRAGNLLDGRVYPAVPA